MKPVDQTSFGYPEGNCFSACVASILELPIAEVPHFGADETWFDTLSSWLRLRGLWAFMVHASERDHRLLLRGHYILSGRSPRGDFLHAVVAHGDMIVHDPHPSRAGLLTMVDAVILVTDTPTPRLSP